MDEQITKLISIKSKTGDDQRIQQKIDQLTLLKEAQADLARREACRCDPKFDQRKKELVKVFGQGWLDYQGFVNGLVLCDGEDCTGLSPSSVDCMCCLVKRYKDKGLTDEEIRVILL